MLLTVLTNRSICPYRPYVMPNRPASHHRIETIICSMFKFTSLRPASDAKKLVSVTSSHHKPIIFELNESPDSIDEGRNETFKYEV